jgi:uncharacterized protein
MKKSLLLIFIVLISFKGQVLAQNNSTCAETIQDFYDYERSSISNKKEAKSIFKLIKACAESGDAEAANTLGILYKEGFGVNLNFNKAVKWFEKAYSYGNEQAAYSLGYMYLKGLGNIPQDYTQAIHWFQKSNYPMAKHWLAKCYYYGYGLEIDKIKAIEILKENAILNSQVLLEQWNYEMEHPEKSEENYSLKMKNSLPSKDSLKVSTGIYGEWVGEWKILDWSGQKAERNIPFFIELIDNGTGISNFKIKLDGVVYNGNVLVEKNQLIFPNLILNLKNRYTDNPKELSLDYVVTDFNFSFSENDEIESLTGNLGTTIQNWSEPGPPSKLILHRNGTYLSQEMKDAFLEQADYFIKIYPNPFEEDLLLYYTLEEDATVSVKLFDYYNPQKILKTQQKDQKSGERKISVNNLNHLNKGLYIVQMQVNGNLHSRIVIKN